MLRSFEYQKSSRRLHQVLTGLMREVIAYIGNLKVVATDLLGSLSPVTGAFLFSTEAFLPFNLALQCLLEFAFCSAE